MPVERRSNAGWDEVNWQQRCKNLMNMPTNMPTGRRIAVPQRFSPLGPADQLSAIAWQITAVILSGFWSLSGKAAEPAPQTLVPTIVSVWILQEPANSDRSNPTPVGGLSDLFLTRQRTLPGNPAAATGPRELWAITDRGPNATSDSSSGKRRTLLMPRFTPAMVRIGNGDAWLGSTSQASTTHTPPTIQPLIVPVTSIVPLTTHDGQPLSGRPNGIGKDEPILDAASLEPVATDPNGIDPEGLVVLSNGTRWIAEEYRPSLLEVSSAGCLVGRFVPQGEAIKGAGAPVHEVFPRAYASRRDNRGFEAMALSMDESRLFVMLQSPLENPRPKSAAKTGNVRLLVFDTALRRPVAEYLYRLGDPSHRNYLTRGAPPKDGKLPAMSAIDSETLIVVEQADDGLARLYQISLARATNTLGHTSPLEKQSLEEVRDLQREGIVPVSKTLIADLEPLIPAMAEHIAGSATGEKADTPKLEGIVILNERQIAIINDNDFAASKRPIVPAGAQSRNCLWLIDLPRPLAVQVSPVE